MGRLLFASWLVRWICMSKYILHNIRVRLTAQDSYCKEGCQSKYGICSKPVSSSRPSFSSTSTRSSSRSTSTQRGSTFSTLTSTRSSTTSTRSTSTSTHSTSSTPSPTQPVSTNARCGKNFGSQTCLGSKWGSCCSNWYR